MNLDDKRFLRELGDRLRERRQECGLTQEELAKRCRLHRTFVGSVERGERNVSILNLRTIAKALRMVVADLTKDLA
jgi:transcriptional regulator with XRE-family HTH domain